LTPSGPRIPRDILDWEPVAAPPDLGADDLHLWRIDCGPQGAPSERQWEVLSERERARAGRLRLDLHRERYVRTHAGLREILSRYLNLASQSIDYKYGQSGKPALANPGHRLELNLTTSQDLALVALSLGEPVGIDCEQIRARRDPEALVRRMLGDEEAERLAQTPRERRLAAFHMAWTTLEAEVKADGRGLARRREPPAMGRLEVAHFVPQSGFIAAVARASLPPRSRWRALRLEGT